MVLFGFKNTGPIPGHDDRYNKGCNGRRWALVAEKWRIGLDNQWRWEDGEWTYCAGYYAIGVRWGLSLGHEMIYYDGEHHSFNLGPLYVTWWR